MYIFLFACFFSPCFLCNLTFTDFHLCLYFQNKRASQTTKRANTLAPIPGYSDNKPALPPHAPQSMLVRKVLPLGW